MMTSKGGNKILGTVRSPMSADVVGKPHVPARAANTTIPGSAPKSAPIVSPQADSVIRGGRKN